MISFKVELIQYLYYWGMVGELAHGMYSELCQWD